MKKTIVMILLSLFMLSLAACGQTPETKPATTTLPKVTAAPGNTTIPMTKAPQATTAPAVTVPATTVPAVTTPPATTGCSHVWSDATCAAPKTCTVCGITEGTVTDSHTFENGKCAVCGLEKVSQGLAFKLTEDGTAYKVTGIGTCTDIELVIPSSYNGLPVVCVGGIAFWGNENLISVVIPNSVHTIESTAWYGCKNLKSVIIPEGVKSIGQVAFSGCKSLEAIIIPDSVTSMGSGVFERCESLTNVIIPDSITEINSCLFSQCHRLERVVIPNSVTSIGQAAFQVCRNLTNITYEGTMEQWNAIVKHSDWKNYSSITQIVCTDGTINL